MKLEEKISRTLIQLRYQDIFATLTKKEVAGIHCQSDSSKALSSSFEEHFAHSPSRND